MLTLHDRTNWGGGQFSPMVTFTYTEYLALPNRLVEALDYISKLKAPRGE